MPFRVLFSITAAIGTSFHVDHAIASIDRPSVQYNVPYPFFQPIWIGEGDTGF